VIYDERISGGLGNSNYEKIIVKDEPDNGCNIF
jgi:hypothetical protein